MIHVVTARNRSHYEPQLVEYHRLRHDIYIGERKWQGLVGRDGLEYDAFDDDDAMHVLDLEGDRVIGASRLYPTTKPHMLATVCPQLAEIKGIPAGPDIWEWTRLFAIKERRDGRYGGGVIGRVFCGALEYCRDRGVGAVTIAFEAWWLPRFHEMGWTIRPLGLPGLINDEWWVAGLVPVDDRMIAATRAFHRIDGPVLAMNEARREVA